MNDLAERALAAHENSVETQNLRKEEERASRRAMAHLAITQYAAETFGIVVPDELVSEREGQRWLLHVTVDEDTNLLFVWEPDELVAKVRVCDQLYWDLPPGALQKRTSGGAYGCYSTDNVHNKVVTSLAELGGAIARVRKARELWIKKHSPDSENQPKGTP